jgi:hypothetical protein
VVLLAEPDINALTALTVEELLALVTFVFFLPTARGFGVVDLNLLVVAAVELMIGLSTEALSKVGE